MSYNYGSNQPPHYGQSSQWVPHQSISYAPHAQSTSAQTPVYPYYVPGLMAVPVGVPLSHQTNLTYVTNIIHQTPVEEPIQVLDSSKEYDWIPAISSTASHLTGKAVIGGHEADGSLLWVIRANHDGSLFPGKFSVKRKTASYALGIKEVHVENFEVLCIRPENLQWLPVVRGNIPPNTVEGGKTKSGSPCYIGRVNYQQTVTPGRVSSTTKRCLIGFGGSVVRLHTFEVLCRIK